MLALAMATGCSKFEDFGDTNVNPGGTNDPILSALLTNVEAGLGGYAAQTRGGYYCQYFSETQYSDASLYALPQLGFTGNYSGSLYDMQNIILKNTSNNMSAVARIVKSYIFWTLTDSWGDVPYSESLQGNGTPKYDSQEEIYKGMIEELKVAIAQFDDVSVISGDVIYSGDVASWKRLANSLRMLMALRLSKQYPDASGYAATEFKAALSDGAGYISENSQNFTVNYPGGNFKNPWYNLYDGRKDVGESNTMTDLMTSLSDGRQSAFGADVNGNPSSLGVPYGWTRDKVDPWTADNPNWAYVLSPSFRAENSPVVIIAASQVYLARAEAADRGWTSENSFDMLKAGVNASFAQWGIAAPAASYFTQSGVAYAAPTGTGANISKIAIQRHIATYPDGLQGWCEWRRTGYPVLTPAEDAITGDGIVRRYVYASGEYTTNKDAVEAAVTTIPGGDDQDSRVWWDR
jgi:hypothetical protein